MVDRVQALLNVRADAELGRRSEHDPDLAGVELAAQFGLSGRPLVIVNEGDLNLTGTAKIKPAEARALAARKMAEEEGVAS